MGDENVAAAAESRINRYLLDFPKAENYLEKQMGREKKKLYPVHGYTIDSNLLWRVITKSRGIAKNEMVKLIMGMPVVVRKPSRWRRVRELWGRMW